MSLTSHSGERVRLKDGAEVLITRVGPGDASLLADAFARLSEESRRLRFLGPKPTLSETELRYLTEVDGHNHEALAAIDPQSGRGVAVGRFVRDQRQADRAEVAITVADDWQRRGLGKLLLEYLADRARDEGVQRFTALVSTDNRNMQGLLHRLGSRVHIMQMTGGVADWEIELAPRGLGPQLEEALRAAAAGHLQMPPQVCDVLRRIVPVRLERGVRRRRDLHLRPRRTLR